jgi:DnaK suppressor protein
MNLRRRIHPAGNKEPESPKGQTQFLHVPSVSRRVDPPTMTAYGRAEDGVEMKERAMTLRMLESVDAKELKSLLLDRRKVLEFDLAGLENETTGEDAERAGTPSSAPGHLAELASDASEKAVMFGQLESQSGELAQVRDALERLDKGAFGLCDNCNDDIPLERLRAIPYARLCIGCKTAEERG